LTPSYGKELMKRKITLLIGVAAPLAIALIAAGCGTLRAAQRIPQGLTALPPRRAPR